MKRRTAQPIIDALTVAQKAIARASLTLDVPEQIAQELIGMEFEAAALRRRVIALRDTASMLRRAAKAGGMVPVEGLEPPT